MAASREAGPAGLAGREAPGGLCGLLVEQGLVGLYALDGEHFTFVNARFADTFGYPPGELVGRMGLADLAALEDRTSLVARLARWRQGRDTDVPFRFAAARQDGSIIDVEADGRPVHTAGQTLVVGALADVTDRVRAERQLEHLAFYDTLTELPNRALFFDRLNQAIARGKRYGGGFAVVMVDLDSFKDVNDTRGHEVGDALLKAIGTRLLGCVRESDTVARMGGDEFMLLLNQTSNRGALSRLARKLVDTVGLPVDVHGLPSQVGASVGIALFPEHGRTIDDLVAAADAAMYASKTLGKGRYTFFDPTLVNERSVRAALIEWSPAHEVGVRVIDEQHRRLTELVNALASAIAGAESPERVRERLAELVQFTVLHFQTEEALMDRHGLNLAAVHKEQHRKLTDELTLIHDRFSEHGLSRTLVAVKDWLLAHVQHSDRELGRELNARGVR